METPEDLYEWIVDGDYDAIVVDLDKTNWGIFAVRYLRSKNVLTSVIGLSNGNREGSWSEQRASFLENGGDDFIRSPANPRELAASLRATTRRGKGLVLDVRELKIGDALIRMNLSTQTVSVNGQFVHFTGKEMLILSLLASNRGRTQSKEMILGNLYSAIEDEAEIKIIDVFVCKIRKKLDEIHPDAGRVIETVWGRGYQIIDGDAQNRSQTLELPEESEATDTELNEVLTFRTTDKARLKKLADNQGTTVSLLIREAIESFLETQRQEPPVQTAV
ncbi:MAG: two-component system, cell cycle response regulator CtrA [Parcubacteria bacterium C7867-007]|nr:MAG: two-component system, cell cycle response regulator CtrA [Parcubacteria bacterium C7867-007]